MDKLTVSWLTVLLGGGIMVIAHIGLCPIPGRAFLSCYDAHYHHSAVTEVHNQTYPDTIDQVMLRHLIHILQPIG